MASLRKFPGCKNWFACFRAPDGRRIQRSTGKPERSEAQKLADKWEAFTHERKSTQQALRTFADLYRMKHGETLPDSTVKAFFEGWLKRREGEVAPVTLDAYGGASRRFLTWLEEKADELLVELDKRQMLAFRDHEAAKVSPANANKLIKLLRVILEDARRDGHIPENPAKDVPRLKTQPSSSRRPLTLDEIQKILAVANEEWQSLILFGLYTGQRLADIASLTWSNVDLPAGEVHLRTRKTGRMVRIPICRPLAAHIERLPISDDPRSPLHPRAHAVASKGATAPLSAQFRALLVAAGLAPAAHASHKSKGKGRDAQRTPFEISFHSLRHTATSLMKNAGISPAIVQDIIGHESAEISAHYTHVEHEAKAKALNAAMPDFTPIGPVEVR